MVRQRERLLAGIQCDGLAVDLQGAVSVDPGGGAVVGCSTDAVALHRDVLQYRLAADLHGGRGVAGGYGGGQQQGENHGA